MKPYTVVREKGISNIGTFLCLLSGKAGAIIDYMYFRILRPMWSLPPAAAPIHDHAEDCGNRTVCPQLAPEDVHHNERKVGRAPQIGPGWVRKRPIAHAVFHGSGLLLPDPVLRLLFSEVSQA
ncbi:unnamed protein product, partial [Litomosoides sigmodontis]